MKLNYFTKQLSIVGRWLATALMCVVAIAVIWQSPVSSNSAAMAAPATSLIATTDVGNKVQGKASEDAGRTKNFVHDTASQVKQTARNNAARVERATDNDGNFVERKAKRDAARIQKRADEDASRTQKAIDNTKNAVERTVDGIKDVFSN